MVAVELLASESCSFSSGRDWNIYNETAQQSVCSVRGV